MELTGLTVQNYRSLHRFQMAVESPCVVLGGNGAGKSSLYRALQLIYAAATGNFARRIAEEGGMASALWAGPRRFDDKKEFRMGVEAEFEDWTYRLTAGLPTPNEAGFLLDPRVKEETLDLRLAGRKTPLRFLDRTRPSASLRNPEGRMELHAFKLAAQESLLSQIGDPARFPELARLRETIMAWRFYDEFDASPNSAMRQNQVGTMTPVLASNGLDLPAALATIHEMSQYDTWPALQHMIADGLDGSELVLTENHGQFSFEVKQPGLMRALTARELSSGTLRFIALAAALHPLADAALTVFNEPEMSLHESLLPVLGDALARAAKQRPIWVITHSSTLAEHIARQSDVQPVLLQKVDGATRVA